MLSEQQISELRRLLDVATPGPWYHGDGVCGPYLAWQAHEDERGGPEPLSDYDGRETLWLGGVVLDEDRAFIAALRNAAPALLSAAADAVRLREAIEDLYAYSASCSMERIREGLELALSPAEPGAGEGE